MSPMRDGQTNDKQDSATQLLICEPLSFAINISRHNISGCALCSCSCLKSATRKNFDWTWLPFKMSSCREMRESWRMGWYSSLFMMLVQLIRFSCSFWLFLLWHYSSELGHLLARWEHGRHPGQVNKDISCVISCIISWLWHVFVCCMSCVRWFQWHWYCSSSILSDCGVGRVKIEKVDLWVVT